MNPQNIEGLSSGYPKEGGLEAVNAKRWMLVGAAVDRMIMTVADIPAFREIVNEPIVRA
ncbi:MAG TPA: hypothetical protein VFB59_03795 [Candidatus Saccharimonadales bacterium]|nr:hypothetical protein [Candidatus Saccharimonadales bacterium]